MKPIRVLFSALALTMSQVSLADIIKLKNGNDMEGRVVEETAEIVAVELAIGGRMTFKRSEVESIEKQEESCEEEGEQADSNKDKDKNKKDAKKAPSAKPSPKKPPPKKPPAKPKPGGG